MSKSTKRQILELRRLERRIRSAEEGETPGIDSLRNDFTAVSSSYTILSSSYVAVSSSYAALSSSHVTVRDSHTAVSSSYAALSSSYINGRIDKASSLSSANEYRGSVIVAGTGSTSGIAASQIVYLDKSGGWRPSHARLPGLGSKQLIGIALTSTPHTHGVVTIGMYKLNTAYTSGSNDFDGLQAGQQVYMSSEKTGSYTTTIPSGSGEIVRVVGHAIDTSIIYFNPSPDYIEI